jgi:hypothetical protein
MSQMSEGLRMELMHERETYLRDRARRESRGTAEDRNRRWGRKGRTSRPAP